MTAVNNDRPGFHPVPDSTADAATFISVTFFAHILLALSSVIAYVSDTGSIMTGQGEADQRVAVRLVAGSPMLSNTDEIAQDSGAIIRNCYKEPMSERV
jgi:hypothetical protein